MKLMSSFLTMVVIAASCGVTQAAPASFKVIRRANLPTAVKMVMPRGAKTWFYGRAPAAWSKRPLWLHFYGFPGQRVDIERRLDERGDFMVNPSDYALSIWERKGKTSHGLIHRINFIRFSGREFFEAGNVNKSNTSYLKINIYLSWLHRSVRQIPIMRIDALTGGDTASTISSDVLFIFRNGLQKRPHMQQFVSSSTLFQSDYYNFEKTDKVGNMMIEYYTRHQESLGEDGIRTTTKLLWDGNDFTSLK